MEKLLILSDLHITAPGQQVIGLDPAARLQMVLEAAITAHPDAAAVVLLGDLTHHGAPAEYAVLRRVLGHAPLPVIPMIGNHDRRAAFLAAFPDVPTTDSGHVQSVQDLGDHRLITLDSLDGPPYPDGHHAGRLCPDRLAFLDRALATRAGRYGLVCVHHPPFDTGIAGMDRIKLADGEALLGLLARHGDVHLLCGHLHLTINGQTGGVPWSVFKSPCHQGIVDLERPNAHLSTDAPGGYGLALLTPGGVVVHHIDVDPRVMHYGGYDAAATDPT